jgi:hypothetical protein
MLEQRYPEACEKLAESQRLEAAVGTQLNLALCYERIGKLASAYVEYHNALATSLRADDSPRVVLARQRISALEPKLSRLVVILNEPETLPGLWVKLDGTSLGLSALNSPIPVDLGVHEVEAGADGKLVSRVRLDVNAPGNLVKFSIPRLESVPVSPPPAVAPKTSDKKSLFGNSPAERSKSTIRSTEKTPSNTASWIAGGAGIGIAVVTAALGAYFGFDAFNQWSIRNRHCPNRQCDAEAVEAKERAETSARLANYLFATSALGATVGVTFVVTANHHSEGRDPVGRTQAYDSSTTMVYAQGAF